MARENFFRYIYAKRSELQQLRFRDILMARAITDIHRHMVRKKRKLVPLWSVHPIHSLDREAARQKLDDRVRILTGHKDEIMKLKVLTRKRLLDYLPSISGIKVIRDGHGGYISFEGNGRVEAFRQVFSSSDNLKLEVEVYYVDEPKKILRRVRRVQKRNFKVSD